MKDNSDKSLPVKIEVLEKRIRNWIDKKYDLLGIPMDKETRDKLFDIEMAIFMNQYLFRTFKFEETRNRLGDAFDKAGIMENDNGR